MIRHQPGPHQIQYGEGCGVKDGICFSQCASTSTRLASIPYVALDKTFESI